MLLKVTDTEKEMYEELRKLRNDVGHAAPTPLSLHDAIKKTTKLRKWASRIDAHIEEHFLVLTKYTL
jgi:hypothetical protein